jgi:transposase
MGGQDKDIATDMQINYKTAALWRQRFCSEGPDCLWEVAAGRGRKPQFTAKKIEEVVNATLQTKPAGATHWSCRTMADKQGLSKSTINRVWQSHGLQPHRTKQFKLSRDPKFLEKLIDAEFPAKIKLHVVMDNYGTHKHPKVKSWLQRHPRFIPHFIPTSSSWLNLVEGWFGELTQKSIRRGAFVSVEDLIASIDEYLGAWNTNPKPFIWTATVDSIVEKLSRCKQTLEKIQPGCTLPRSRKAKKNSTSRL